MLKSGSSGGKKISAADARIGFSDDKARFALKIFARFGKSLERFRRHASVEKIAFGKGLIE
jgi:hypothetical protein